MEYENDYHFKGVSLELKTKRFLAVTTAAVLLSVTLLCVSFTAVSAGHHCEGTHCPVCTNLDKADSTVKQLAVGGNISAPMITPVCTPSEYVYTVPESEHRDSTPIALKTRKDE